MAITRDTEIGLILLAIDELGSVCEQGECSTEARCAAWRMFAMPLSASVMVNGRTLPAV